MFSPGGHNPEYSGVQILQWKKSHTVISGCDSQQRQVLADHIMLGISSVGASHGSAGWPRARGGVHNLVSSELRVPLLWLTSEEQMLLSWEKHSTVVRASVSTLLNGWHDKY